MATYWAIGWVLAATWGVRIVLSLRRFRVDSSDPTRFDGAGRLYRIHSATGRVHGVSKTTTTTPEKIELSAQYFGSTLGGVSGKVRSRKTVLDQFFVTDASGNDTSIQLTNFNVAVADGHTVTAAWGIRKGKKSGKYFMVANHSTGQRFFNDDALFRIAAGHVVLGNVQTFLSIFFVAAWPFFAIYAVTYRLQLRRFRRSGVQPLIDAHTPGSVKVPPAPAKVDELEHLAALAREGLLTEDEWVRAKELFLGKQPSAREQALNHLRQIYWLYRDGALTESEFNTKKWEILSRESRVG